MVLITGGSSGLGSAISLVFAKNGYDLLITYLNNEKKCREFSKQLNKEYGIKVECQRLDIRDELEVSNLFNQYEIDIVINNASLSLDNEIENKNFEEFMDVIKTNIGGTYLVCKYATKAKYIINLSSKDGIDTYNPISIDYCASKAAIINMSKNFSLYYRDKIIYCVCPGWINTESVLEMNPNYLKNEMNRIGQVKLLDKNFVAEKIFMLINSNYESGSVIIIDEEK